MKRYLASAAIAVALTVPAAGPAHGDVDLHLWLGSPFYGYGLKVDPRRPYRHWNDGRGTTYNYWYIPAPRRYHRPVPPRWYGWRPDPRYGWRHDPRYGWRQDPRYGWRHDRRGPYNNHGHRR